MIETEEIVRLAKLWAEARKAALACGWKPEHHPANRAVLDQLAFAEALLYSATVSVP